MGAPLTAPDEPNEPDAIPLLDPDRLNDVVAVRGRKTIDGARFLADAAWVAADLPDRPFVLNCCDDRYNFMCAFAAALLRGQLTVLPPDRLAATVGRLKLDHDGLYAVTEPATARPDLDIVGIDMAGESGANRGQAPTLSPGAPAVRLFTSGSTGEPQAVSRSWGQLVAGVHLYRHALGLDRLARPAIVATVPSQHSYGLETAAMLQMTGHASVYCGLPNYSADVAEALHGTAPPRVLVTTPINLRALAASRVDLPPLSLIVSATAPLTKALADDAEQRWGAPVKEVYGCTEAGLVATRRTADGELWTVPPGIRVGDGGVVTGSHLPEPVTLGDTLEAAPNGTFRLLGRKQDMINVAGNRASLAGLNAVLCALDGVVDGVFYQPAGQDDAGVTRLIAFVVAPARTPHDIRNDLRARIAPAFLPRKIVRLPGLPRNAGGKIAQADLAALAEKSGVTTA